MATLGKTRIGTQLSYNDLADTPDMSTKADKSNVLELDNTDAFTPDADYEPATKKYVDDNAGDGHTQNTDTGTTGNTFTIDSDSSTGKITLDVALNIGEDHTMTVTNEAMTADVTITLPATTGTVALSSTVAGKKPYHGVESYSGLAFSDANKALTLSAITYWYKSVQVVLSTTVTCDLDLTADRDNSTNTLATNKLYYFYFKDATGKLYWSDTSWNFKENVFVATVFWNGLAGSCHNECHNHTRDLDWHEWSHDTIGTRYQSGSSVTYPSTAVDGSLQIETGSYHDEDLDFATGQCTTMRAWYKASASVFTFADYALPYVGTAGQPQWLDTDDYTLKNVGASDYVRMWVYVAYDIAKPIYMIPTHRATAYNTLALARADTAPVTLGLNISTEFKLIYSFIFKGNGDFEELIDYRTSSPVPGGGIPTVSAGGVSFIPTGTISATNVQSALAELDTEKAATADLHTQNTDTGTTNNTFTIDSDSVLGKIIIQVVTAAANKTLTLKNAALTNDVELIFPNVNGTLALVADLSNYLPSDFTTLDAKDPPVADDVLAIADSEDGLLPKGLLLGDDKSGLVGYIKSIFDTIYAPL